MRVTASTTCGTPASRLVAAGADVKLVQAVAGHANPLITLKRYSHLLDARVTESGGALRSRPHVKVRDAIRLIEADGWALVRTRGSHRQYKHPSKSGLVTIPGKRGKDLPPGLQRSILKQAGLEGKR
jgi:predicted RNA binding protein YcfA (HicA-like mRNA interferase family)